MIGNISITKTVTIETAHPFTSHHNNTQKLEQIY